MLRCTAGLPTKDLLTFIDVVRLCPSHRFMLAQTKLADQDPFYEESAKHNRETGDPVDLLYDVQLDDIIKRISRAGIYLHTCKPQLVFEMPVPIAEMTATGIWVVVRRLAVSTDFAGSEVSGFYDTAAEAADLIRE